MCTFFAQARKLYPLSSKEDGPRRCCRLQWRGKLPCYILPFLLIQLKVSQLIFHINLLGSELNRQCRSPLPAAEKISKNISPAIRLIVFLGIRVFVCDLFPSNSAICWHRICASPAFWTGTLCMFSLRLEIRMSISGRHSYSPFYDVGTNFPWTLSTRSLYIVHHHRLP